MLDRERRQMAGRAFWQGGILVVALLSALAGCDGTDIANLGDGSTATDDLSAIERDYSIADAAATKLDTSLKSGTEVDVAIKAIASELKKNGNVCAAVVNQAGDSLWVVFMSGLEYIYDVTDYGKPFTVTSQPATTTDGGGASKRASPEAKASAGSTDPVLIPPMASSPLIGSMAVIPRSNKALTVNSTGIAFSRDASAYLHPFEEVKENIKSRLERLGYKVDGGQYTVWTSPHEGYNATPEMLPFLEKLTDYGVVFIQATCSRHTAQEMMDALLAVPALPASWSDPVKYTGIDGSSQVLTTDTPATKANREKYKDDLKYGRLKIRRPWAIRTEVLTGERKTYQSGDYFGVTANFIRQHNSGKFPDYMVFCINAFNVLDGSLQSEWLDLAQEKSKGGYFVSWFGKPAHFTTSAVAFGNLFQLLTGADARVKTRAWTQDVPDIVVDADDVYPPLNCQSVSEAQNVLYLAGESTDTATGALLTFVWDSDAGASIVYLAPTIKDFFIGSQGYGGLLAGCEDNTELHMEDPKATNAVSSIDIGTYGVFNLDSVSFMNSMGWKFKVPYSAAGSITLFLPYPDTRHDRGFKLLTWTPTFTIAGTGPRNLSFTVTYKTVARGLIAPRSRVGTTDTTSVWSKPSEDTFKARFDGGHCTVAWAVSGKYTVGSVTYEYTGGGSKLLDFKTADGSIEDASFARTPDDAKTVDVSITSEVDMTYTETVTDSKAKTIMTYTRSIPVSNLAIDAIPLGSDMTLQGGSRSYTMSTSGWTGSITWSAALPTPSFDTKTFRR